MSGSLVSIIVPVYNVEKYVGRCIDSILLQSYNNIEIILVDDGSTDSSGNICDEYQKTDSRIKVVHKENGGLSDARNTGIRHASGDYICFIDSDDFVSKSFIEILYTIIIETNSDVAAVGFQMFTTSSSIFNELFVKEKTEILNAEKSVLYLYNNEKYANYAWNKMYRIELFDGIEFPVGRKMEDLGTTFKLFIKSKSVAYNPVRVYYYYQREDSILHTSDKQLLLDKFYLTKERYKCVSKLYPSMIENEVFYFNVVLDCFHLLTRDEQKNEKNELSHIWRKIGSNTSIKQRIKYYIIIYCPKIYTKIK